MFEKVCVRARAHVCVCVCVCVLNDNCRCFGIKCVASCVRLFLLFFTILSSTGLSLVLLFVGHIGGGRGHSVEPGRTKTLPARPTFPTVVYTCSSGYIRYINSRANMSTEARLGGLPNMVYGFIETLCR